MYWSSLKSCCHYFIVKGKAPSFSAQGRYGWTSAVYNISNMSKILALVWRFGIYKRSDACASGGIIPEQILYVT